MKIRILTTGGTIDKVYFDARSEFEVGEPLIGQILTEARVGFEFEVTPLMQKDSLELDDGDRERIRDTAQSVEEERILITHGTDTMVETAEVLSNVTGRTIVLTGALDPARFRSSDAIFNIGMAVAAVQILPAGIYIAMNGTVFPAGSVRKNPRENRFEAI